MQVLYTASIYIFSLLLQLAAIFGNKKAQLAKSGRKNWAKELEENFPKNASPFWFHAASLGEFEQARPLIERIKKEQPKQFVLLTFFSPSGYEIRKNYAFADLVCYLPLDTPKNAKKFIEITKPKKVFFIKYEFWFNVLQELKKTSTPTFLISGIFRQNQHFFKSYGKWFSNKLSAFTHFFVQNKESQRLLESIGYQNTTITGDTRLDRVVQISKEPLNDSCFSSFSKNAKVILFGSSWSAENNIALQLSNSSFEGKVMIAPHEIDHEKLQQLKSKFSKSVKLLSETKEGEDLSQLQVLIVDKIGLLAKLYKHAYLAFIGGGFGKGIHNTLEAVVYNIPVIFGPKHSKFQEAIDLIASKAGFSVNNYQEFYDLVNQFTSGQGIYQKSTEAAKSYVKSNLGATDKVMSFITKN